MARPKIEFDLKQVELCGKCRASNETMAEWFECSKKTIDRNMKNNDEFCLAYKRGFSGTKLKLSEKQIDKALSGNVTMLIWLGKQYLGQKEPRYMDLEDPNQTVDFEFEVVE